jgi:iron complex transport system substrate-binding protein
MPLCGFDGQTSAASSSCSCPSAEHSPVATAHPATAWTGDGRLEHPARRIVSLLPSATEIVCALGLDDRLVAITHECDHPADAVAGLPRVTANRLPVEVTRSGEIDAAVRSAMTDGHGIYALDDGLLAALEPDLVLTQELCRVCAVAYPTVLEAARAAGGDAGPMVVSLEPHRIADVLATIEVVARLAGAPEAGTRLVTDLQRRLASVEQPAVRRRVALVEWLDPLFAPGHWVPEQVEMAGGESVIGAVGERSRESSWEALAETAPDVIVLGLCGFDLPRSLDEWAAFDPPPALTRTPAWKAGELWAIDGSTYVSRPGPRLVDGVEVLSAILACRPDARAVRLP